MSSRAAPTEVRFGEALRFWLKLGFISFGGPAGQIAIMHAELVEKRRWLSEQRFLHALNYCMLLPGPEAQQLATYIGWLLHRTWGGVVAGALFVLPSLLLLILLSWIYLSWGQTTFLAGVFHGIKPAVVAIVLHASWRIGSRSLKHPLLWGIAIAAFVAIFVLQVPFPWIVGGAAVIGFIGQRIAPGLFVAGGAHGSAGRAAGAALIDDNTPSPPHARFRWPVLLRVAIVGVLLWLLPMLVLLALYGWHGTLTQMGWFFTKAALLTFGGAYAVLPYVYQGAVLQYGWLSAGQMIDGLALGETTPGPLIMVVAFVGFVGGYLQQLFGPDHTFAAGVVAAMLVTWFTFLPSFIFILAGGPLVESTRGDLKFTAPLTAITAAVVGVIASLACFFAYHVFWPRGLAADIDWIAALIALAAAIALFWFKRGIIEVIAAAAVVGFALKVLDLT